MLWCCISFFQKFFVDLADFLPDNIRAQEIEPQAFLEGKLVVSGSKKQVIEIAWIEAFTISLPHLPLSLERFKPIQVAHYSDSKAFFLTSSGSDD